MPLSESVINYRKRNREWILEYGRRYARARYMADPERGKGRTMLRLEIRRLRNILIDDV